MGLRNNIILLLFLIFGTTLSGQNYRKHQQWFFGAHAGYNAFWGDITDNGNHFLPGGPFQESYYKDRKVMYGGWIGKEFNNKFSFRSQFIYGQMVGTSDFDKKQFSSSNREFNITLAVDLVDVFDWNHKSPWDWYVYAGIGVLSFRSTLYSLNSGEIIRYAPFDSLNFNSNRRLMTMVIPFGTGINYNLNKNWRFTLETNMRSASSDWLDGEVSNKRNFEGYSLTTLGVTYVFDFPKKGNRGSRHNNFEAMSDNTGKEYRKVRHNGNISKNPFQNRRSHRSSVKIRRQGRGKVFRIPD
ncbi:MAG: hypothetical protein PHR79_09040 [Bacteroidales bacterium]|nr:hypothetical protein [Bacteroidales bacterium]MDY0388037.1 hypothetical protein [Methanolobus sp.]